MYREEDCGCSGHGQHHGIHFRESQVGHGGDCGCGGQGHHGMHQRWHHPGYCGCGCHHEGMGFHRRFTSREEVISTLEEYLKQLQAEAKGVEDHLAELKKEGESPRA